MTEARASISGWRRLLHWSTALLVLLLLALGKWMSDLDLTSPAAISASMWKFSLHKTVGLVVLFITLIRFASMWLGNGFVHSEHSRLEVIAASAVQAFFLCALVVLPTTGLIMHGFSSAAAPLWIIPSTWLHASQTQPALVDVATSVHHLIANGLIFALLLHVAGALKHHWIDRDNTLGRMLTGRRSEDSDVTEIGGVTQRAIRHGSIAGVIIIALAILVGPFTAHDHEQEVDSQTAIDTGDSGDSAATSTGDTPTATAEEKWHSVAESSDLKIRAVQGSDPFEAEFARFTVIVEEQTDATPKQLDVTIQSNSFGSGISDRDQVVAGSDWLDAKGFPQVVYQTTEISAVDGGMYQAKGLLKIRGVEAEVATNFSYVVDDADPDQRRKLTGSAQFDRFMLDLGRGEFAEESAAGKMINVEFDVVLTR